MKNVREATFELLRELGITTIFGNPGSTEENFLMDYPADFKYILALQEASVMSIADAYAQATGKPAMVNIHTAAGTGNAMGNLATAFQNKTPLIVTAGQQTREMLLLEPWLTNLDPTILPRPWVKWAYQPSRPEDVPGTFMRAFATAVQPPQGPVYLALPLDDWAKPAGKPVQIRSVSMRTAADPERLQLIAEALKKAKNPALIIGAGVDRSGGWDAGVKLAETLKCAVFAPPGNERTAFPENHPLYRGALIFAIAPLAEQLKGYDLVVVFGAPVFRYYPYVAGDYLPDGTNLWHITDDPDEAARAPVGNAVLADPALALEGLNSLIEGYTTDRQPLPPMPEPAVPEITSPLTAAALFATMNKLRPEHTVMVEESPSNLGDLHKQWKVTEPLSFFTMASGGLGFGLPAAVGIALAERETGRNRQVIAVIGDGSFQYSVQCLWTAAQHKLNLLVVVPNNAEYAILKAFAVTQETPDVPGLNIPGKDIVQLAQGYGCTAKNADTVDEITAAMEAAFKQEGPTVLVVPISPAIPPLL
ncbi:benzoylformate decarboxylase [uncultured Mucilaginibacter sp.]|uniref:benzoylformate decarboxylase n=1 Tax=uncultured Mucilaginibacter sp. TaxID=797541 RepID=UPI0026223DD3|nr:benzoylformate decarboxylase [uncultured Mucilaginibacter sp.]